MNTEEVIIEKVISTSSNNDCMKHSSINDLNNSENISSTYKENVQNHDNVAKQVTDDIEVNVINNVGIEQTCTEDNSMNQQPEKTIEPSTINQNDVPIIDTGSNQCMSDLSFAHLQQKNDDICIIYERNMTSPTQNKENEKVSSLVSIAVEYGNSDSETENTDQIKHGNDESECEKEVQMQIYRQNTKGSSSEESDSEDDSTSSSDSVVLAESSASDSDDNSKKKRSGNGARGHKNNEIRNELDDLPPIEDLKISVPEVLCDPLGEVAWMVEQLVVVKPKPGKPTLNLDTVLFVDKGQRALGKIFDVFGQVNEPHYCVRFNSSNHIKESDVKVGMTVYYCPNTQYTSLVFLHELMKIKGIDANADDPPEFSDDEEERAYYEKLKAKQTINSNDIDIPFKRKRPAKPTSGWQSNHPWNRNAQKHRRGYRPQIDRQSYAESQSQSLWSQPYQSSGAQYGYGPYSIQPMQYMNHNVNNFNQSFYPSQNYYNEDSTVACSSIPPGYTSFQNPSTPPDARFQGINMPWQPQTPQVPMRMKMPWVPLPPPPPPPPSGSSSDAI